MRRERERLGICCAIDFPQRAAAASLEMGPETGGSGTRHRDILSNMIPCQSRSILIIEDILDRHLPKPLSVINLICTTCGACKDNFSGVRYFTI